MNATMTQQIERGDWIETHTGRTGKVCWIDGDDVFCLMDDRPTVSASGLAELVDLAEIARVIKAR